MGNYMPKYLQRASKTCHYHMPVFHMLKPAEQLIQGMESQRKKEKGEKDIGKLFRKSLKKVIINDQNYDLIPFRS